MKKKEMIRIILKIYRQESKISWKEEKYHFNKLIKMKYEEVEWIYLETLKIYNKENI